MVSGARSAARAGQYECLLLHLFDKLTGAFPVSFVCMRQQAAKYRSLSLAAVVLAIAVPVTASAYKPLRFGED